MPKSIASLIVHLPSPESSTYGVKFFKSGSFFKAILVRSKSHDLTTLPCSQI